MAINTIVSPDMPERHSLSDLVIHKILQLLPTKPAVQVSFSSNQWRRVLRLFRVLDFDEHDDFGRKNLNHYIESQNQHDKFINFLDGYLEYREKYDQIALLDKLRLHLRMYLVQDEDTITEWLKYANERGVKDLDIKPYLSSGLSLKEIFNNNCYCLPWVTFANARSLTHLNLECMRITTIQKAYIHSHDQHLLPSLETMSFASIWFDDKALPSLLRECPSIKSLSVTECFFSDWECRVSSSSLKSLEIKECNQLLVLKVDEAKNLETLTFQQLSPANSNCEKVILNNSFNLKHINICVDELGDLLIFGCHRELEASVTTQHLQYFEFVDGHLSAKVSVKAIEARISVWELTDKEWFSSISTHFPKLMTFLKGLRCCKEIYLHNIQDVQALIVPETYRKMTSQSPLPNISILNVTMMLNTPVKGSRVYLELMDSLKWIAPSACISINKGRLKAGILRTEAVVLL